jgi:hypothetical protein
VARASRGTRGERGGDPGSVAGRRPARVGACGSPSQFPWGRVSGGCAALPAVEMIRTGRKRTLGKHGGPGETFGVMGFVCR